jgi:lipopolysaccharide transport system permease protein
MSSSFLSANADKVGRSISIWRYRELLRNLVLRNLRVKYQRSVLGFFWTLLNPLLTVAVLIAVFTYVVRIAVQDYWAFLISGYFVWNFLQQAISAGTYTLAEHAHLGRSVAFPKEVLIFSAVISRLVEYLVELVLVVIALGLAQHHGLPASFSILPLLITLQLLLAVGLQLPIATLSVFYKDVENALPTALVTLFYISPVFYPAQMIPESFRSIYFLNPIAQLLTLYQEVLYYGKFPSAAFLGTAVITTLIVAVIGYAIFNSFKNLFAEIV